MSAHKKLQLKAENYELAVDCYMHPWMTDMHNILIHLKYDNTMKRLH